MGNVPAMSARVLFCTDTFWDAYGDAVVAIDPSIEVVRLVGDEHVTPGDLERITLAFYSPDAFPERARRFLGACARAPRLEWVHTFSAGVDGKAFTTLHARGVVITNSAGAGAPSIAQSVMLSLLALARDLPRLLRSQAARVWDPFAWHDLHGVRLGIVGLGAIGTEVARLADAFGMHTIGLRRTPRGDEPCETWTADRLPELLGWADAIVVTAPLTDATRGLFDAAAFAAMRPGAWFVNVGRGRIVDESALVDALTGGHLGGAALDVFATEPLPTDSPLWSLPNVIVTPHSATATDRTDRRAAELFVENLRRSTTGDELVNLATPDLTV